MINSLHYTIFFCACENKQNKLSYLIDLINFSFYLLQMNMLRFNAHLILKIEEASKTLFRFKSLLSRDILLYIASHDGTCELRDLFKSIDATTISTRQHIQILEASGYVLLFTNNDNKRAKTIKLTNKSFELLSIYEAEINSIISQWQLELPRIN